MRSQLRDFDRHAHGYGFHLNRITGSGHRQYRHANGAIVHAPSTPSDPRTIYNFIAQMRRALRWPSRRQQPPPV